MQPAHDVQLRDAQPQRLARLADDLLDGELEPVRIPLLARERAELAAQDAVVGVVDVPVEDVAGTVAGFALAGGGTNWSLAQGLGGGGFVG